MKERVARHGAGSGSAVEQLHRGYEEPNSDDDDGRCRNYQQDLAKVAKSE
jgi:hypothetical protein